MKDNKTIAGFVIVSGAGIGLALIYRLFILNFFSSFAEDVCLLFRESVRAIPFGMEATGNFIVALLTGDRSGLDKDTVNCFRQSGASHILALSGLHLGFIYLLIRKATLPLGNFPSSRIIRYIFICLFSIFYTLMTGASPSTVRALLFILIRESAILFPERSTGNAGMFATALIIQLAANPSVISSIGFQLSYLAMLGIFLFARPLQNFFPEGKSFILMKKIWDNMAMTLCCQVFTAPLCWHYFHSFPKYFLLTNLFALPLTSCIMALAAATIVLHSFGICPQIMIKACDYSVQALISVLKNISSL